jgi:hypothetical protein
MDAVSTELNMVEATIQLHKTVDELFVDEFYELAQGSRSPFYLPSTSSSFLSSRSDGGAYKDLHRAADAMGLVEEKDSILTFERDVDDLLLLTDNYAVTSDLLLNKYSELTRRLRGLYQYGDQKGQPTNFIDMQGNLVKMIALSEALKVRVITKGNPYRTFLLQPVQKFLWNTLKKHACMTLIGETVTPEIVQKALGRRMGIGMGVLSGDYSDATNKLASWASEIVARRIIRNTRMDETTANLFVSALTEHDVEDPERKGHFAEQKWGQLMGSVVSFPILCIINAAVCRWTLEIDRGKTLLLRDCPLLINGDDCVFKCSERGLRAWKRIASFFGLEPSIGKFFYTREFAQINSMNFYYHYVDEGLCYTETAYINMGLFMGLSRSQEEGEDVDIKGVGLNCRCRELIAKCPSSLRTTVMDKFLKLHKPILMERFGSIPWFTPEAFGGLGLPIFTDVEDDILWGRYNNKPIYALDGLKRVWTPTNLDRRIAHEFKLRGTPPRLTLGAVWKIRQLAKKSIPVKPTSSFIEDDNSANLVQLASCAIIFSRPMGKIMVTRKKGDDTKDYMKIVHKIQKQWTKAKKLPLLKALSIRTMLEAPKLFDSYPVTLDDRGIALSLDRIRELREVFKNAEQIERNEAFVDGLWD